MKLILVAMRSRASPELLATALGLIVFFVRCAGRSSASGIGPWHGWARLRSGRSPWRSSRERPLPTHWLKIITVFPFESSVIASSREVARLFSRGLRRRGHPVSSAPSGTDLGISVALSRQRRVASMRSCLRPTRPRARRSLAISKAIGAGEEACMSNLMIPYTTEKVPTSSPPP